MNHRDRIKLLFGPYQAPRLRKGDKASCLYRDRDVKVIDWTNARIPWPVCRALVARGGGHGLLVDEELARAIRQESAAALMYWWGVACSTVALWRRALGVGRMDSPGSRRLILAASEKGAEQVRHMDWSADQREERRRSAVENNLGRNLRPGHQGEWWTEGELALLGTMPDHELAARLGKTHNAIRQKRRKLGIANPCDRRRREHRE
jgi:hypothetical protein